MSSKSTNKNNKMLLTKPFIMYVNDIRYHSFVVGIPTFAAALLQFTRNLDINNSEYKKVVTGVMIFSIVMFLLISFNDKGLYGYKTKKASMTLFISYVIFSAVVLGLVNKDKLSPDEVNIISVIMFVQSIFIIVGSVFVH